MAKEIERKFLVVNDDWRASYRIGTLYRQAYLSVDPKRTVRIRTAGNKGYITIKGLRVGITAPEFEYEIPLADANEMIDNLCKFGMIEKIRYKVVFENLLWEIDEFIGENEGLIIAEVELKSESEQFVLPSWVGTEVSDNMKYTNAMLAIIPYCTWEKTNENP